MKTGKHFDFKRVGILIISLTAGTFVPYLLGRFLTAAFGAYGLAPMAWFIGAIAILLAGAAIASLIFFGWVFVDLVWCYIFHNGGSNGNR